MFKLFVIKCKLIKDHYILWKFAFCLFIINKIKVTVNSHQLVQLILYKVVLNTRIHFKYQLSDILTVFLIFTHFSTTFPSTYK